MKIDYLKQIFVILLLIFISSISLAQTDSTKSNFDLSIGADIMSRYIWRGTEFGGGSPSIQPSLALSFKNLEIGVWGAYSTGGINASQEVDLYLDYTFLNDMITVIFTDYYFPSDTANYNYFGYDKKTGHIGELGLMFNGTEKIPISFSAYVNLFGNDAQTLGDNPNDTTTFNLNTGIQYSNYFELAYNNTIKNIDLSIFLGFTFSNPKEKDTNSGFIGEAGFYGNEPGIVNLGITASKSIKITDSYSLPITASLITNPQAKKIFLVFGISF